MTRILPLISFGVGLSLIAGSVFASWAVNDLATPLGIQITLDDGCEIKFLNYDGSVHHSELLSSGSKLASAPSDPTLADATYVFDGWSTDSTNYTKSSDNFATKTYTTSVTYYPRFASYGYSINGGNAQHLANAWDINNNISIAHGASLTLGTYIYGKTSLENADDNTLTIPNAGGYALVCDAHNAAWDSSKAGVLSNWHVERYLTVAKTSEWNDLKLFARFNKSEGYEDKFLSSNGENSYYVYSPYDALSVNFGGVNNDTESVPSNLAYAPKYLDAITLTDTASFTLPERVYYLTGKFGSVNWNIDANYALTQDGEDTNLFSISNVEFEENDTFKVVTNSHVWYVNATEWEGRNYTIDSGNMKVTKSGVYTIDFHANWDDKISLVATSLYSTFSVTYDSLASGSSIYVCGLDGDWDVDDSHVLVKEGETDTYSATFLVSNATENFQFVISDGSTEDWNTLNPTGNRGYTLGSDYDYTYVAPAANTRTLDLYHSYSSTYTDGRYWWKDSNPVWGVYAYTTTESDGKYYLATYIETWDGNKDHLQVTIDDTCTKLKILRCDPSKVDSNGVPTSASVWNETSYYTITENTYLDTSY